MFPPKPERLPFPSSRDSPVPLLLRGPPYCSGLVGARVFDSVRPVVSQTSLEPASLALHIIMKTLETIESLTPKSLFCWEDRPETWFRRTKSGFTNIETQQRFSFKTHPDELRRKVLVILRAK